MPCHPALDTTAQERRPDAGEVEPRTGRDEADDRVKGVVIRARRFPGRTGTVNGGPTPVDGRRLISRPTYRSFLTPAASRRPWRPDSGFPPFLASPRVLLQHTQDFQKLQEIFGPGGVKAGPEGTQRKATAAARARSSRKHVANARPKNKKKSSRRGGGR